MRTIWLLAACTIIPAMACHHHAGATEHPGISSASTEPSTVRVENKHWLDVVVYVEHDGQRSRLGTVTAATTASFTLRPAMIGQVGEIQLIADPVGSQTTTATGTIIVKPGTHVDWTLQTDLARSSLSVY